MGFGQSFRAYTFSTVKAQNFCPHWVLNCIILFNETSEALGGPRANVPKKREIEDNSKKLGGLFAKLNSGDISKNVSDKLLQLCQAIDIGDFMNSLQIQISAFIGLEKWRENLLKGIKQQFQETVLEISVDRMSSGCSPGDANDMDSIIESVKGIEITPARLENFYLKLVGIDWLLCMLLVVLVVNVNQGVYFLIVEALCFMFLLLRHAHASYHIISRLIYDYENYVYCIIF
ncbi:unnamed protein product [Trifolium pratense]|uniref:Uncharacterized protein n=1 Tax=Trifolium pratense TaxID=57577 RepID=A0ACB0IUP9_TRIPR|nr:unnamed protein product [Trifolium pratense]